MRNGLWRIRGVRSVCCMERILRGYWSWGGGNGGSISLGRRGEWNCIEGWRTRILELMEKERKKERKGKWLLPKAFLVLLRI